MIVLLIGLGLLGAWYVIWVNDRAEHLITRNFHNLNQLDANIARGLEAVQSRVDFWQQSCAEDGKAGLDAYRECIADGFESFDVVGRRLLEPEFSRPGRAADSIQSSDEKKVQCLPELETGQLSLKQNILEIRYKVRPSADQCGEITIAYDIYDDLRITEGYFDFLALAKYPNEPGGSAASVVVGQKTSGEMALDPSNIRELFNLRHPPGRLSNLSDLEEENALAWLAQASHVGVP
ncbi:MAG: hypothetical protein AAGA69_11365, partial [Pseudomonadota bacterium]